MKKPSINNEPAQPQFEKQTPNPINPPTATQLQPVKSKNPAWKKLLMVIGGIVVGIFALAAIIITVVSINSKKLECTSNRGSITIMYNDDTINGYATNGLSYNLDDQKAYAERIGIEAYLEEFIDLFESNTGGTCVKR